MKPGDLIGGKYRLERLIGQGAMGTVWAARNERTDKAFAIKLMLSHFAKDPTLVQRFFMEARVCGRIEHPSLVAVYDLGVADEADEAPFLVMELLRGQGLDAILSRDGRLDPAAAVSLLREVAVALALAHAAGIVHRDIKPANIFLHQPPGARITPKLLDFGVSKTLGPGGDIGLTRTGVLVGTPLYMSPEQARGQGGVDARSDLWSVGVILYQCIAGVLPFTAPNYNALLTAILTHRHVPLRERIPGLPPLLSETVDLCLVKSRDRRIASASELAERLQRVGRDFDARNARPTANAQPVAAALPSDEPLDGATEVTDHRELLAKLWADPRRKTSEPPPSNAAIDDESHVAAPSSPLETLGELSDISAPAEPSISLSTSGEVVDAAEALGALEASDPTIAMHPPSVPPPQPPLPSEATIAIAPDAIAPWAADGSSPSESDLPTMIHASLSARDTDVPDEVLATSTDLPDEATTIEASPALGPPAPVSRPQRTSIAPLGPRAPLGSALALMPRSPSSPLASLAAHKVSVAPTPALEPTVTRTPSLPPSVFRAIEPSRPDEHAPPALLDLLRPPARYWFFALLLLIVMGVALSLALLLRHA